MRSLLLSTVLGLGTLGLFLAAESQAHAQRARVYISGPPVSVGVSYGPRYYGRDYYNPGWSYYGPSYSGRYYDRYYYSSPRYSYYSPTYSRGYYSGRYYYWDDSRYRYSYDPYTGRYWYLSGSYWYRW